MPEARLQRTRDAYGPRKYRGLTYEQWLLVLAGPLAMLAYGLTNAFWMWVMYG